MGNVTSCGVKSIAWTLEVWLSSSETYLQGAVLLIARIWRNFFQGGGGCKQMHTLPGFSPPILFNAYKIVVKLWGDFENYPQMH